MDRKQVTLKMNEDGNVLMSRSKAKRIANGLGPVREVTLDFRGIQTVGQGFADELFRVFANKHPEIRLTPINCQENVHCMIQRALKKRETG